MRRAATYAVVATGALAALAGSTASAEPVTYRLDEEKSQLVAHLLKDGALGSMAHDHVVRARDISGKAVVDRDNPAASRIEVTVKTRTLAADETWLRKKYGLNMDLDASDRGEVEKNMKSRDQLWVDRHPTVRFVSTGITPARTAGTFRVKGKLTIRGVTREVTLTGKASADGRKLKASGQLKVRQSLFGYKPYSAAGGLIKVKDQIILNLYLEGLASNDKPAKSKGN